MTSDTPGTERVNQETGPTRHLGSRTERNSALENLAMLLSSGVDPSSALGAVALSTSSRDLRKALGRIQALVQAGNPLWDSLNQLRIFPLHQIWLIRVGEQNGTLAEHLQTVVGQLRKDETFRSRLRSALLYPLFVLTIGVVVGLGVAWLILPRLVTVFTSLKVKLPLLTRLLLGLGKFLAADGAWAVPLAAVAGALLLYVLFIAPKTKWIGENILIRTPGISRMIREVELGRLGYVMGSLLKVGVPITDTLHALTASGSFGLYRDLYGFLDERIAIGQTFQQTFMDYPRLDRLMPTTVQQIIVTAEQSGRLASATTQIGITHEERSEVTAKNLTVILEPVFLFVVWLGVVLLAIAIITPIYSLLQGVHR
jgi:type II secretory pathway component PulF